MLTPIPPTEGGASNTLGKEEVQEVFKVSGEYYISSRNNSHIRLGRDRYGGPQEGAGAVKRGKCGAIDLWCGMGPKGSDDPNLSNFGNPNFTHDAARVYISQRCDIDSYFGIAAGKELHGVPRDRSGVGIKADHVRLFAMNHMKLVTGNPDGEGTITNSLGGRVSGGGRIEFITGNNTEPRSGGQEALQPVPLGDNLENLLTEMLDVIDSLRTLVLNNTSYIQELARSLCSHMHADTPQPIPGSSIPDPSLISQMLPLLGKSMAQNTVGGELHKANVRIVNLNYLNPYAPEYILSAGVYTT